MSKSAVYHKNSFIGEVEIYPKNLNSVGSWMREIRISHLSPPSDRCPPLSILHMISTNGICFKIETKSPTAELFACYSTCIGENKTAVVALADEEIHLVALPFRKNLIQYSCFWGFSVTLGLYNSCLVMLNLRCLGIVFDLDETLIVANTMRSFEDRINVLQQKISNEADPHRIAGMIAEVKRYQEDKSILKQFIENDQVIDNGIVFKVQPEIVQPVSDSHQSIIRPIIRLQDKHIILTRVNPAIRDTSVLVRLRPAWEDLRSYLTARGRKRFEVYVCTMAERDYALEMWRLLDPQSNLISSMELQDRIVCVKPGTKKSLLNVFQGGTCHPKMSLVIDDRLKVWDEKDQPRVHVVPAFAPYYAPQAEANSTIPVLCVARNVACNVRGSFFKEFDEELLPLFTNIFYEDEIIDIPSAPDVGNYLISEDDTSAPNGSKDPIGFEGMTGVEVERRLKDVNCTAQVFPPIVNDYDLRPMPTHFMASSCGALPLAATQVMMPLTNNKFSQSFLPGKTLDQAGISEAALLCSNTEEGEVPESDLDPNTRRRLLILQHGQDMRDPPPHPLPPPPPPPPPSFPFRPPLQFPVPPVQPRGSRLPLEEVINPRQVNKAPKEFPLEPDAVQFDRKQSHHPSFSRGTENPIPFDRLVHEKQRLSVEAHYGDIHARGDIQARGNRPVTNSNIYPGEEMPVVKISSSQRDSRFEADRAPVQYSENPAIVLQDIVMKSGGGKVEFRTDLCNTAELQFSVEVWLVGDKISEGIGRTRKEAQRQAVMNALQHLAKKYVSPDQIAVDGHWNKLSHFQENGFTSDSNSLGHQAFSRDDHLPVASTSDSRAVNALVGPTSSSSVAALKELCTMEGYTLNFQVQPSSTGGQIGQQEAHQHAQVEIAGQIMGKGIGKTWEEAKIQAAEEALESLKSMLGQFTHKRPGSPRLQSTTPNKQLKQDFSRASQRIPSSGR